MLWLVFHKMQVLTGVIHLLMVFPQLAAVAAAQNMVKVRLCHTVQEMVAPAAVHLEAAILLLAQELLVKALAVAAAAVTSILVVVVALAVLVL